MYFDKGQDDFADQLVLQYGKVQESYKNIPILEINTDLPTCAPLLHFALDSSPKFNWYEDTTNHTAGPSNFSYADRVLAAQPHWFDLRIRDNYYPFDSCLRRFDEG